MEKSVIFVLSNSWKKQTKRINDAIFGRLSCDVKDDDGFLFFFCQGLKMTTLG